MCGIGGFFGLPEAKSASTAKAMLAALAARGPDASHASFFAADGTPQAAGGTHALLHARLAIIDPRPEADQPMASANGRYWLCYNGEVYDWQGDAAELSRQEAFRTRSDTEYLLRGLAAWGVEKLLPKLTGMFAFALVDWQRRELVLVRDRFGKKPLLWWSNGKALAFSSLLRGLIPAVPASARQISPVGIDAYLAHRYIPAPLSCLAEVQRLPAGHLLRWPLDGGAVRIERWYDPAACLAEKSAPDWRDALDQAISRRCVADRPVGLFLSGGIDSSVIATRLAALGHRFAAFTAAFPGSEMDETAQAAKLCQRLGLAHHTVDVPKSIRADFGAIVASLDEPFADPSAIPLWYLARATSQEVKVVLGGDGGDELLAGYKRYAKHLRTAWRGSLHLPGWPVAPSPRQTKWQRLGEELSLGWAAAYQLRFSGMSQGQRHFLQPEYRGRANYWMPPDQTNQGPLEHLLAIDRANYLPEYILRKGDLTTMGHGLELRAPLLDHHFVHAVAALPAQQRFTKPPKKLFAEVLPADIAATHFGGKKRGFNPPLQQWLREDLIARYDGLGQRLAEVTAGQIDAQAVAQLLRLYREGAEDLAENVLQLLVLDESLQQLKSGEQS